MVKKTNKRNKNIYGIGGFLKETASTLGSLGTIAGAANSLGNTLFGSLKNELTINAIENNIDELKNKNFNTTDANSLLADYLSQNLIGNINKSDLGSEGIFSNKITNLANNLRSKAKQANMAFFNNFNRASLDLATNLLIQALFNNNVAAYGGPINMRYTGTMSPFGNRFMSNVYDKGGGIYIKPSKRSTFTAAAKKHGKGVLEFASLVLANKENYSPAMRKKALFARNAAKWHALGGELTTKNTTFNNGITYINNGNNHEENRYEGVLIGVDNEGVPNLVELDELIYNDYVIPKRTKATKELLSTVNLPTKYLGKSLADIGKKLSKESLETPNDPISKRTLDSNMNKLIAANEIIRQMNDISEDNMQMTKKKKYVGGGFFDDENNTENITWDKNLQNVTVTSNTPNFNLFSHLLGPDLKKLEDKKGRPYLVRVNSSIPKTNLDDIESDIDIDDSSLEDLRFAPAIGAGLGTLLNLFSKPNYSRANYLENAARQVSKITPVTYSPLGEYMTYKPQDTDYMANRLAALAAGTRRALIDLAGGNRATAINSLLAADYNSQLALADALRQSDKENWDRLMQTYTFNRGTKQTNAEMALKAAMANQEARIKAGQIGLSGIEKAMTMKDAIDAQRAANFSGNISNLFDNLGNIGIDALNRRDAKFNILHSDYSLPMSEYSRLFGKENAKTEAKRRGFTDDEISKMGFSKGGKINRKKKKGGHSYAQL